MEHQEVIQSDSEDEFSELYYSKEGQNSTPLRRSTVESTQKELIAVEMKNAVLSQRLIQSQLQFFTKANRIADMLLDGDLVITHPNGEVSKAKLVDKDESTANGNPKEAVVKENKNIGKMITERIQSIYGRLLKMFFDCDRSLLSLSFHTTNCPTPPTNRVVRKVVKVGFELPRISQGD
uniref:BEN domain-containing protein n=1 Tax=Ditylenchus dipsaci TaxID=166011 RepID=A0A915CX35_9BILA